MFKIKFIWILTAEFLRVGPKVGPKVGDKIIGTHGKIGPVLIQK